ncbi:MAG: ribonuclease R family protein, partial [Candidatus Eremiobacterota bacterium]
DIAAEIPVEDLYELLIDEAQPEGFELKELGQVYFGSNLQPEDLSGLYRALEADRTYFNRKGERWVLRPRAQVEEILTRLRVEAEKEFNREQLSAWLKNVWQRPEPDRPVPVAFPAEFEDAARRYFTWIRDTAVHGPEAARFKEVQTLLKQAGIAGKDACFRLMLKAGLWSRDENLLLYKNRVATDFPSTLSEAAEQLARRAVEAEGRLDLRGALTVTIDDAETTEIDDALSLETTPEGYRVGIHIADAAAYVEPGSELDLVARDRGTAIYLPDLKIRMLPPPLSEGACSLVAGRPRPAFSFLVEFDREYRWLRSSMASTVIQVDRRLTYQEADAELAAGCEWKPLLDIAEKLRREREEKGALTAAFPRLNVRCTPDGVVVDKEAANAPGQVLVSEMMILANRLAGEFLAQGPIPAIFRSQPPPDQPISPDAFRDPVAMFKSRRFIRRGEMGLTPAQHFGLGLDAYVQVTSPIRRYGDLVLQRQLKAALAGQPCYDTRDMQEFLVGIQRATDLADLLERDRRNYWVLRYLEERRSQEFEAVVLQNGPERNLVQISEVLWETDCPHLPGQPVSPGALLMVRLELVWPREGVVRLSPLEARPNTACS